MKAKRVIAVIAAATMMMSSSMAVCAADGSGGSGETTTATVTSTTSSAAEEESVASGENAAAEVSVETAEVVASVFDESKLISASGKISVGGKNITTSVAGAYLATKVNGVAITTSETQLAGKLNLSAGQTPYVMVYDFDQKKSNLAMDSFNIAAEVMGANFVEAININLGAKQNGKFITLSDGSVQMVVGIPKTAIDSNKTYFVVGVQPGGAITYYEDVDTDPNTVTFEVPAGLGAYAIMAK